MAVSTATLALVTVVLLAVVVTTAVYSPHRDSVFVVPTGRATQDSGFVNLSINATLAIQVDPSNGTIVFGGCMPRQSLYWCATNDTIVCDGNVTQGNCSGDLDYEQFIRVDNIGNIDALVSVQSTCNATDLIGGTNPLFQYITLDCNATGVASWANFSSSTFTSACANLSYLGGMLRLYANVTIPTDAVGGSGPCVTQADIVFSAVPA